MSRVHAVGIFFFSIQRSWVLRCHSMPKTCAEICRPAALILTGKDVKMAMHAGNRYSIIR